MFLLGFLTGMVTINLRKIFLFKLKRSLL